MRTLLAILTLAAIVTPVHAGVVWDETVNGELSHLPSTPTVLPFVAGSNVLNGTVGNVSGKARDYIKFTIPDGQLLTSMNLLVYTPDDIGFAAINTGVHSYFPTFDTDIFFLSGIHLLSSDVGTDLMERFVDRSVTADALGVPELIPNTYCMVIQQTAALLTTYSIEFILSGPVAVQPSTWGSIKALYR
jgi:hypothetical protein